MCKVTQIFFLKSYYSSVSSFLSGDDYEEKIETKISDPEEIQLKESKSEGWLKGIYNDAYNQSGDLWKAVKTDLTEFATVISKDAKTVVVKTAVGMKNGLIGSEEFPESNPGEADNSQSSTYKLKSSINRMLEQVSKALYIPPESDDDEYCDNADTCQSICNRIDTRISNLQKNRKTFEVDPDESETDPDLGDFLEWKEKLNLDDFQSKIAELVTNNQFIFEYYADLVPRRFSHDEFWSRYFYRVASINSEESRREALKIRLSNDEKINSEASPGDWDEGNDVYEENDLTIGDTEQHEISEANVTELDKEKSDLSKVSLKCKEHDDVVVVKHLIDSSSASEDNNRDAFNCVDQKDMEEDVGWEDEIDIDINEDDIELAKTIPESDVLETKWDDWS